MTMAIEVWALVLGGVLIPGGDQPIGPSGGSTYQAPLVDFGSPAPQAGYLAPNERYPGQRPGGLGLGSSFPGGRLDARAPGQAAGAGRAQAIPLAPFGEPSDLDGPSAPRDSLIPFAPTDPSAASTTYPWGAPTAGALPDDRASGQEGLRGSPTGRPGLGLSGSTGYLRPRASRPAYRSYSTYGSYASQQARTSRYDPSRSPAYSPSVRIPKPYQNYTRPAAVSPYMELGRINSSFGDIDNYNQYVKPRLEQRRANRQVGQQIIGLQNSVRTLNRQTQSLRGVIIPQYYMNRGNYYPGFRK